MSRGEKMEAVLYSEARNNLRKIIDDVCENYDEYLIVTKDKKRAVIMSYEEFSALQETLYLLTSKKNRERLLHSIEEVEKNRFIKKDIVIDEK